MTAAPSQGDLSIERMCALSGISRASYYRHWEASAPRQEETGLRDAILTHPTMAEGLNTLFSNVPGRADA